MFVAFTPQQIIQPEVLESTEDQTQSESDNLADMTQSAAFRKWFGKSVVTNADGSPLVVYHGSEVARTEFRKGFGDPRGENLFPEAFFFSPDIDMARTYGDAIASVYLRLENPFIARTRADYTRLEDMDPLDAEAAVRKLGHDGAILYDGNDPPEYVVFDPAQIKATANAGTFDPTSDSILESVEEVRDEAAATLDVDRGTAGWDYDNGEWIGRKAALAKARAALQDKMLAWRGAQGQIAEQGGMVTDAMNVYRLENLMHGRVQRGIENIEREQVEPLLAAMRAAGVKAETLEEYLYARHAQERNERIATINPRMPDGGSGMTTAEAARILAEADTATLAPLANRVDRIIRNTRRRMLEHGLITQEQFDALDTMYQHYVPLRGRMVEPGTFDADLRSGGNAGGRGVDSRGKVVREALGRNSRAANLLGEIIGDTQRSVILAEKARVGRAAMRLVLANPNPDLWTVEPVQTERALNSAGEVYEKIVNDWSDPSIIAVRHKGKLYKLQVTSPELARALNLVGVEQMNAVFRLGGKINRYFSAVLTKYNPAFIAANASRDAIFGLTGMAAEHGEAAALQAAMKYPVAVRAAWRLARGASGTTQADAYAQEFADAGGRTGYVAMPSVEDIAAKVNNVTYGGKTQRVKEAFEAVGDFVGSANDAVENALRLAAFITLRESGMAVDPAAEYAKNLTVNFNRKGEYGSHLNAALLFFNASMQGAHRAGKVLRNPKAMAYVGALAGAQVIAAMAAMGIEDDDGEPLWNKVPDHVKRRNLVMVTPDGGIITVPMPYGFNAIVYGAGRAVTGIANMRRGDTSLSGTAGDWTADVLSATLQAFVPIPVTEGASSFAPVPLQIANSIETNRDGLGFQIRRENPFATGDIPRASLGKPDTMEVFKWAATGLNRIGGGDEFTPPKIAMFDRAPEDLEYLLSELSGGAGKFVVDVATVGGKLLDPDAKIASRDVPITNRFASNIDEFTSQRSMYYDRKAVVERNLRRVRNAYRDGEPESVQEAQELLERLPGLQGARFKRRKRPSENGPAGGVVVQNGSPQFEAVDGSLFATFKAAGKAADARSERVTEALDGAPRWPFPTKGSQARNAAIRQADAEMAAELRKFNEAWARAVVGEME